MPAPVDEYIEALPQVSLRMTYLGQHVCGNWACFMTHITASGSHYYGDGATPTEAIETCLRYAGVNVD